MLAHPADAAPLHGGVQHDLGLRLPEETQRGGRIGEIGLGTARSTDRGAPRTEGLDEVSAEKTPCTGDQDAGAGPHGDSPQTLLYGLLRGTRGRARTSSSSPQSMSISGRKPMALKRL